MYTMIPIHEVLHETGRGQCSLRYPGTPDLKVFFSLLNCSHFINNLFWLLADRSCHAFWISRLHLLPAYSSTSFSRSRGREDERPWERGCLKLATVKPVSIFRIKSVRRTRDFSSRAHATHDARHSLFSRVRLTDFAKNRDCWQSSQTSTNGPNGHLSTMARISFVPTVRQSIHFTFIKTLDWNLPSTATRLHRLQLPSLTSLSER